MSGLVGIWSLDGAPADEALLTSLWDGISHRGPDGSGRWFEGRAGLAAGVLRVTPQSATEELPRRHAPSGVVAALDGRIDNRTELLTAIGLPAGMPDVDLAVEAYLRWGEGFLQRLVGEFALAIVDSSRGSLLLARDPVGTRPLYVWRSPHELVFGSEIKALLRHPRVHARPDDDLLAYYLLQGTARDNAWSTFFEGVESLPPGYVLRADSRSVQARVFWDFDVEARLRLASYGEYVEAFKERFEIAVRRRLSSRHPVGMTVSGGIDSSAVYCQAIALGGGVDLTALTHAGPAGSPADEVRFVEAIERRWGVEVLRIPLTATDLLGHAAMQTFASEMPWLNEMWSTMAASIEVFQGSGVRRYLTGQWGDQVLYEQAYLVDLFNAGRWGTLARSLREIPRWEVGMPHRVPARRFLGQLARWNVPRSAVPVLRQLDRRFVGARRDRPWYTERLRVHGTAQPPRRVNVGFASASVHARNLYAKLRSKYYVLGHEWDNKINAWHGLETSSPFMDRELLSFVMAVPGEVTNQGGRQRSILRDAMEGIVPDEIRLRRSKADFTSVSNAPLVAEVAHLKDDVRPVKESGARGYVDRSVLLAELGEQRNAEVFMDYVSNVLALESWLATFFPRDERGRG